MSNYVYETINGVRCKIDLDTGEVERKYGHYREPIDVYKITNKGEYDKAISTARGKAIWKLGVGEIILDLILEKTISLPATSVFCCLGREVGFNNMVMVSVKQIQEKTKHSRQTVSSALTELKDGGLIREASWFDGGVYRLFFLNPAYFFVGYYPHRDNLLKDWVKGGMND